MFKGGLSFLLISIFFLIDLSAISAQTISPVSLKMQLPASVPAPGGILSIPIKLSTSDKNIYSLQAEISYPVNLLKFEGIDYTSSSFPLEVVSKENNGQISIIRGSFSPVKGSDKLIGTLNFRVLASGNALLKFNPTSVVVYENLNALESYPEFQFKIPEPPSSPSIIKVYAAGTPAQNVYPALKIDLKDPKTNIWKTVKTFTAVKGDPKTRAFQEFTYSSPTQITPSLIRIRFSNDMYLPAKKEDRNLLVDRTNIDGKDYQTEAETTYSLGSWTSAEGCKAGFKKSEWLHCNGYFEFK